MADAVFLMPSMDEISEPHEDYWPSITVVTPSFNQAEFLERTIRSVLCQRYPALEYFIVDGGSTDGSVPIILRYASELNWWCSEPDGGQAAAIAKGFARSSGEILCWLNSDDIFLPGALHAVGEYFRRHPEVEAANGGAYCIDSDDKPVRHRLRSTFTRGVSASQRRFQFYGQDGVYQPATFWRRKAYFEVGGINAKFSFAMDLDLFIRLAGRQRFQIIPAYLACFRIHQNSKSGALQEIRKSEADLLRREASSALRIHYLYRVALYARYRMTSLFRKLILQLKLHFGYEIFPTSITSVDLTKYDAKT